MELLRLSKEGLTGQIYGVVNISLGQKVGFADLKEVVKYPLLNRTSLDPENVFPVTSVPLPYKVLEQLAARWFHIFSDEAEHFNLASR